MILELKSKKEDNDFFIQIFVGNLDTYYGYQLLEINHNWIQV